MRDRILLAEHREHGRNGRILFRIIPSFDEKIYNLRVQPPNGSALTFVSMRSALDGSIKAVKYRFADRYVFLFASEFNLIVTKSVFDMFEEDDTPIPEWDDSVLIDRYLGQSAGDHNTLQTELSAVCFGNQEKEGADQNGTE